jgi:hypothetical protein
MVRPERFELPTPWFVAMSKAIVSDWSSLYLSVKYGWRDLSQGRYRPIQAGTPYNFHYSGQRASSSVAVVTCLPSPRALRRPIRYNNGA